MSELTVNEILNKIINEVTDLMTDEDLTLKNHSNDEVIRKIKSEKYDILNIVINIIKLNIR